MTMPGFLTLPWIAETLTPQQRSSLLFWLGILLVIVVVGFSAMMIFRRRITADDAQQSEDVGFSLSDLRAMRDRGEITAEEYERTRAKVVASVKRMVEEPKPGAADRKRGLNGAAGAEEGTGGV